MDGPLRILILEDVPHDAELMSFELRQAQLPHVTSRVESREEFIQALEEFPPDLILADFSLPQFDGLEALALAQEKYPQVPFIFVSGAIGEETAIDTLKRGATDYVLKSRLTRLGPAALRALQEARERQERRQAQEALKESEQQYRLLVKSLPAVVYRGYFDSAVDFFDTKVEELTGYPKEDFDSRRVKWHDLVVPADLPAFKEAFITGLKSTKSFIREYRIRKKDGSLLWLQDRGQIICGAQGKEYVSGVFFDISERKRSEEALRESEQRLRFLTTQLMTAQERERKRISMELHDELGQALSVLKLQIRGIARGLRRDQDELRSECQELLAYLDELLDNVRRLSRDLSPSVLEDLGLMSALKYLMEGAGKHFAVNYRIGVEDLDGIFPPEAQIIIYRIFQESLTNITKHARATEVRVSIERNQDSVAIALEDNGTGFELSQVLSRRATERGLGLAALDERARMLGGSCHIWSRPGAGTRVTCEIPLRPLPHR